MRHEKIDMSGHQSVPVLPHILKTNDANDGSVNMVTDGPLSKGDSYSIEPMGIYYTVTDIIESRPARGDWSGESYAGMNPTFNRIKCVRR